MKEQKKARSQANKEPSKQGLMSGKKFTEEWGTIKCVLLTPSREYHQYVWVRDVVEDIQESGFVEDIQELVGGYWETKTVFKKGKVQVVMRFNEDKEGLEENVFFTQSFGFGPIYGNVVFNKEQEVEDEEEGVMWTAVPFTQPWESFRADAVKGLRKTAKRTYKFLKKSIKKEGCARIELDTGRTFESHVCGYCGERADKRCGRCKLVYYCSGVCQRKDKKNHPCRKKHVAATKE